MAENIFFQTQINIEEMSKRREAENDGSPIGFISNYMLTKAQGVQEDIHNRYIRHEDPDHNTVNFLFDKLLSSEEEMLFMQSFDVIVFASLLPEIEHAVVEGQFSMSDFFTRYNNAAIGTLLPKWDDPANNIVEVPDVIQMRKTASKDKTFADFFEQIGIFDLPDDVISHLDKVGVIGRIRRNILPPYREVMKSLIL